MAHLIPTRHKFKLPHTHSYPIGAEAITASLQDTPPLMQLTLSFYFHSHAPHPLLGDKPITVLEATYQNLDIGLSTSNTFIERGWHDERWELTVRAVLRPQRARVKELLLAEGLPRVAQWLATPRDDVWRFGRKSCEVLYSPLDDALVIQEN